MGIWRRWDEKIVFMRGMYWEDRSPEREIKRIRDVSVGVVRVSLDT